jgi:hypothetical protein
MSGGVAGASAGSVAYIAAVANAIKVCGTIVRVDPEEFSRTLSFQENPLVVKTVGGLFSTSYKYLTSYRGLAFHCKSPRELRLPKEAELISIQPTDPQ